MAANSHTRLRGCYRPSSQATYLSSTSYFPICQELRVDWHLRRVKIFASNRIPQLSYRRYVVQRWLAKPISDAQAFSEEEEKEEGEGLFSSITAEGGSEGKLQ